jgi:hypothetical protein
MWENGEANYLEGHEGNRRMKEDGTVPMLIEVRMSS